MKREDPVRLLHASVDSRSVNVKRCDVRPRAATLVLVLNVLPSPVGTDLGVVNPHACLNARLLVGRDDEFVRPQASAVPTTFVQIQDLARSLRERRITGPDPRSMAPRLDRVGVKYPPNRRAADRVDVLLGDENLTDVRHEQSAERLLPLRGNLASDALDAGDDPRGKKTAACRSAVCP